MERVRVIYGPEGKILDMNCDDWRVTDAGLLILWKGDKRVAVFAAGQWSYCRPLELVEQEAK